MTHSKQGPLIAGLTGLLVILLIGPAQALAEAGGDLGPDRMLELAAPADYLWAPGFLRALDDGAARLLRTQLRHLPLDCHGTPGRFPIATSHAAKLIEFGALVADDDYWLAVQDLVSMTMLPSQVRRSCNLVLASRGLQADDLTPLSHGSPGHTPPHVLTILAQRFVVGGRALVRQRLAHCLACGVVESLPVLLAAARLQGCPKLADTCRALERLESVGWVDRRLLAETARVVELEDATYRLTLLMRGTLDEAQTAMDEMNPQLASGLLRELADLLTHVESTTPPSSSQGLVSTIARRLAEGSRVTGSWGMFDLAVGRARSPALRAMLEKARGR